MRVLLVSVKSAKTHGGIAAWTQRYLACCDARGIDCTLVNTQIVGRRAAQTTAKRSVTDEFVRTRRIFKDLKKALKENCDAAHLNTSCGTFGLFRDYLIARRIKKKGIPLITHYHCDIPDWIGNSVSRRCLGELVKCSDKSIVLCTRSQKFLKQHYGAESLLVPNFVEESMVLTEPKTIRPHIARVCFVGRVSEQKGALELFAVAKQLPGITFALIGEVSAAVAKLNKPENVLLPGAVPNEQALEHMDQADLFLFPSHSEGCSMALLEAMARGVPSVATDVGANADLLEGCGVIVKKNDVSAMVAAIRQLEDPLLRQQLSQKAIRRVMTQYTHRQMDKLITVIEDVRKIKPA